MKCPFCNCDNLEGADSCEGCEEDLSAIDIEPKSELERALLEDAIAKIPPRKPVCLKPEASVYAAAQQMNQYHTGCIVVVGKNDKLIGIVTERDILYRASQKIEEDLSKLPLQTIMTENPETLSEDDTIAYALNRMSVGGFRHIPILQNEQVVGFLSIRDILKYIVRQLQ